MPWNPVKAIVAALSLIALFPMARGTRAASIPPPSETPATVIVSGNTSTAVSIKTVRIGQDIPRTYAGTSIHNMSGFVFYVSQHYALQSDMGDDFSTSLLEVAELAYPHWVELTGAEPPDPDTRMYFVYASTADLMNKAITNDTGLAPPANFGGGITLYVNHSAYNYPSGTLVYHKRALIIHENLHLLQMVVYGTGGLEDFTYSGEQSVYDPVKKQLTVMVFDKATVNNWTDAGLSILQQERPTFAEFLPRAWSVGGAPAVMFTQFLWTDPDRFLKWQIWRDEYYLGHIDAGTVAAVTASIFGPLDALNGPWQDWLRTRHNSFHYVDWGWEQEGNTLWSYGFPQHSAFSQTDLIYTPGEKAEYDPYRMDYPAQPLSALVGPVKRGVEFPSVGATVDFSRNHENGSAGMGLGVIDSTYYAAMIEKENVLAVFSQGVTDTAQALPREEFPLPAELVAAGKANSDLFGLTLRIEAKTLTITVRSGPVTAIKTATFETPINADQRDRMLRQPMAVLAKSNSHGITPYIDDAREPASPVDKPSAANFWRFEDMDRLETLYKAAWHLGAGAPASLRYLKVEMLNAVKGDAAVRARAASDYESRLPGIFRDVQQCKSDARYKALALADLAGLFFLNTVSKPANASEPVRVTVTVINRLRAPVECTITFLPDASARSVPAQPSAAPLILNQYQPQTVTGLYSASTVGETVQCRLKQRGEVVTLTINPNFQAP